MHYLFLFFLFALSLFPDPIKKGYISKTYSSTDGLANNIVSSIDQDKNGFLWIGTYGGISRYDGREFRTYTMKDGLSFDAVRTVFADKDNDDVWVGTELGLTIIRNGKISSDQNEFPFLKDLENKDIRAIAKIDKNNFLIGTTDGLFRIKEKEIRGIEITKKDNKSIQAIYKASNESIWVGTKKEGLFIVLLKEEKYKLISEKEDIIGINEEIESESNENRIIVSYRNRGLYHYSPLGEKEEGEMYRPYDKLNPTHRYLICENRNSGVKELSFLSQLEKSILKENKHYTKGNIKNVNSCFIDKENTIWVGTYGSGLKKYYHNKITKFSEIKQGLNDPNIRFIIKDSKNRIWLGTQTNVTKFENGKFTSILEATNHKSLIKIRAIVEDDYGRIWFGSESGLFYLQGNSIYQYEIFTKELEKPIKAVYSMDKFKDALYVLEGKKIRRINLQNIQDQSEVTFDNEKTREVFWRIVQSLDEKNLYLQSSERILKLNKDNNKFITVFKKDRYMKDNNKLNKIQVFLPISEKHFLIGDDKLVIDKDDVITFVLTKENELPDGQIVSILPYRKDKNKKEPEGYWIGTSKGLVHYIEGRKAVLYNKNDGLAGDFCNFNSSAADEDYAYIGTSEGLSIVPHNNKIKNDKIPNVYFTKIKINKEAPSYDFPKNELEHHQNTIQFDAASLSLVASENNEYEFVHIQNGIEQNPSSIQNSGTKTYYNLPYGTHIFKVRGANNDKLKNEAFHEINIRIAPPFYFDWRFMTPLTLLAFGLMYGVYTLRVYQIKQENLKLEALVQIRTKELFAEKETSERLLLNILPKNIAERLKNGESNIADSFAQVTVLFADIVGFTKLSQTVNPWELVSKLNDLFSRFDKISVDLKVEKIKTIGDCYMVVAGLPEITTDHASIMIEVAKQMLSAIDDFNKMYQTTLAIRIGINTGEVVAGVIGTHKFIYDLWGDSVNTASRMESHGVPGRIHVTESTYNLVKDKYQFESRGIIEIKGKGNMETYLLSA